MAEHRTSLVVALIGLVGTLGAALIGNWSKIFPSSSPSSPSQIASPAERPAAPARAGVVDRAPTPAAPAIIDVAGLWIDVGAPMNRSQMTQDGRSFSFRRQGVLDNGQAFQAVGRGTLTGARVTLSYTAQYGFGTQGVGTCSGTVSGDGARMDMTCQDSVLGTFSGASLRQ